MLYFFCFVFSHILAVDDLITEQITIKLEQAGTLPDSIGDTRKYKITNLKIIGDINGTDVRLIRDMAGADKEGNLTYGKLAFLDLSDANIVSGGEEYYKTHCTSTNVIGSYFFSQCNSLISVTLPQTATSMWSTAFGWCERLVSVDIPSKIPSIPSWTFQSCSSLTSITIPSSVTSIDQAAFRGCSSLLSIVIPSSVIRISAGV